MATEYAALCSDFYINQKLSLKMDLPFGRETMLDLFARLRKSFPELHQVRRFDGELALESTEDDPQYRWVALTATAVRSGLVNPKSIDEASALHRTVLEVSPFFLSISPLDVEYLELVFGFDLHAEHDRNEVVFDALFSGSSLASVVQHDSERVLDAQPFLAFSLDADEREHAFIEVKTRPRPGEPHRGQGDDQPISVYLTVRRYGAVDELGALLTMSDALERKGRQLVEERLIPNVVVPIRQAILSPPT